MSPPTAIRPSPAEQMRPWFRSIRPIHVLLAVLAVATFVALRPLLEGPGFVPRITFQNPTVYDLGIDVTDNSHDGWMAVWTAERNGTTVAEEIYDIGDVWIFRFSAQGETSSELRITRQELERNHWRVAIPEAIGDELRDQGAPPPP